MKKPFAVIGVLLTCCILLTGCGGSSGEPFLINARERNILKEEYNERYNHYENTLEVGKKASVIYVIGNVTSGTINLKIIENDKDGNAARTYEYQITDTLNETIEVDKKHSTDWTLIVDFNEDSEGHYKVEVYG